MGRLFRAVRAALFAAAFLWLWWWIASRVRRLDSWLPVAIPESLRVFGVLLLAAGVVVVAACITFFAVKGEGTPAIFDPPRKFVAAGPYQFVRNPMYLGAVAMIAGYGLMLPSAAVVLLSLAFFLFAHIFVLLYEEPHLRRTFAEEYQRYCQQVPRWLPRRRA